MKIVGTDGETLNRVKVNKVTGVRPCGTQVLIELLTPKEALGTDLEVPDGVSDATMTGAPQGYILDMGLKTKAEEWGFNPGDRVTLHGNYTPLPEGQTYKRKNKHRPWILVEPHQIKAVLNE